MPASTPSFGIPKVALVMARLIIDGTDRGSRLFIVPICTDRAMHAGITFTRLGLRSGTSPLDFAATRFDHVLVPHGALLSGEAAPTAPLQAWWDEVWRIPIGTMAIAAPLIPTLKAGAYIAATYAMHRRLTGRGPILAFRTQHLPVLHALAVGRMLERWYTAVRGLVTRADDARVRHASVIVKTTVCRQTQRVLGVLAERCGAQGTFEANYIARAENDAKSDVIAEGDVLTLCIRLFSELLLGRYAVPLPQGDALLVRHARALLDEHLATLAGLPGGHRDLAFNALLPEAEPTIEAVGHAMAYTAALDSGLSQTILDLYECAAVRCDPAWYVEHGLSRKEQRAREDRAVMNALPRLETYLEELNIAAYVSAPIVSDTAWKAYFGGLTVFTSNAAVDQAQSRL